MEPKKIALLAAALVIAVVTALLARSMFSESATPQVAAAAMPEPEKLPHVLVATKALPVGTIVGPDAFRFQPWPEELMEKAYFVQGKADQAKLVGSVVRVAVSAGQPMTLGAIIQPGDRGFLAAALSPGMRAMTVPVSVEASVAGFIFPGDRVDLLLTQSVSGGGDGPPLLTSETFLRNVRVLATDQRTTALDEQGKPVIQTFANVTLELTPRLVEKVNVALRAGTLSLALRSLADTASDLEAALASGTVEVPGDADKAGEKAMLTSIASRPQEVGSTYVTGADISRYQRRSVPGKPKEPAGSANGQVIHTGPVVRVARGTEVSTVPVGSK
jgi:pilus assembly protein CpaB